MLGKVKTHAEERLRMYLMKRHKVKNRRMSTGRFPSRQLYVNVDFTRFRQQLAGKRRKPQCIKNIGKPCAGSAVPYAWFDEEVLMKLAME